MYKVTKYEALCLGKRGWVLFHLSLERYILFTMLFNHLTTSSTTCTIDEHR